MPVTLNEILQRVGPLDDSPGDNTARSGQHDIAA